MNAPRLSQLSVFAALLLLVAATGFGLWIESANEHTSRLERREDYAHVFSRLAAQPGHVPADLDRRLHEVRVANRIIDTHAHAANMALVVVLFALLGAVLDPARRWPLAGLTLGAIVYPTGLAIQAGGAEFAGQLVAAAGATGVIAFAAVMAVRFLVALRRGE